MGGSNGYGVVVSGSFSSGYGGKGGAGGAGGMGGAGGNGAGGSTIGVWCQGVTSVIGGPNVVITTGTAGTGGSPFGSGQGIKVNTYGCP